MGETSNIAKKHKLRWCQFRISHLLILMFVVAVGSSIWSWHRWKRVAAQREAAAAGKLVELGGRVSYDWQYDAEGWPLLRPNPPPPDAPAPVAVRASLHGGQFNDAALQRVASLSHLEVLWLVDTEVTDTGLAFLEGLPQLRWLWIENSDIGDAGLEHLHALPELESLYLIETQATHAGVAALQRAQLGCKVHRR